MYCSEFCMVDYLEHQNAVFLAWKQFCCGENYRRPVRCALELCQEYGAQSFVIDARNGFEDEKEDVRWGFEEFLPKLAETACRNVIFIVKESSGIEEEMDLWTAEFSKYFSVTRVNSYEQAVRQLDRRLAVAMTVLYTVSPGRREEFLQRLRENGVAEQSRREAGNLRYEYYLSEAHPDKLLLLENWEDSAGQELHTHSVHFIRLQELKAEYVTNVEIETYRYRL